MTAEAGSSGSSSLGRHLHGSSSASDGPAPAPFCIGLWIDPTLAFRVASNELIRPLDPSSLSHPTSASRLRFGQPPMLPAPASSREVPPPRLHGRSQTTQASSWLPKLSASLSLSLFLSEEVGPQAPGLLPHRLLALPLHEGQPPALVLPATQQLTPGYIPSS